MEAVVIGGSAGSLDVLIEIIKLLDKNFMLPVIVVVHRQRNGMSELTRILRSSTGRVNIFEPEDKQPIEAGSIYIAPQNYHLLIERSYSFSLDYSEPVKYSRPSIDVTFESAARVYKDELTGIILSGANGDGTAGLEKIDFYKGVAIAQNPASAQYPAMPRSAIAAVKGIKIMQPFEIGEYLNRLPLNGKSS
jgi:two-component system chemotaxis response regulator CheB